MHAAEKLNEISARIEYRTEIHLVIEMSHIKLSALLRSDVGMSYHESVMFGISTPMVNN